MKFKNQTLLFLFVIFIASCSSQSKDQKINVLIVDGSSNHYIWPKTTQMLKDYLEETTLFDVSIHRMDTVWLGIKYNPNRPESLDHYIKAFPIDDKERIIIKEPKEKTNTSIKFDDYDLVVSNLGAFTPNWTTKMKSDFNNYINNGGGLVVIHSANNAWGDWPEYNEMIALGGWGDRDSTSGPFVYYNKDGNVVRDSSDQICGSHGAEHEFVITSRKNEHPILKDLPLEWLHTNDELYDRMRGPFKNATILATAYSDVEKNAQGWEPVLPGTGKDVPVLMTVQYGAGRIFHTTLGHFDYSMECSGFITTFQRGAEWAATGLVTQEVPSDFPTVNETRSRKWSLNK